MRQSGYDHPTKALASSITSHRISKPETHHSISSTSTLPQQLQGHYPAHPSRCGQSGGPPIRISPREYAVMRTERACEDRSEKRQRKAVGCGDGNHEEGSATGTSPTVPIIPNACSPSSRYSPYTGAETKSGSDGMLDRLLDTRHGVFGIGTLEACRREVESDQASMAKTPQMLQYV